MRYLLVKPKEDSLNIIKAFNNYKNNSKRIRHSYNNPLKSLDNVALKDELERKFYDDEAQKYLENFKDDVFKYDPAEVMPISHKFLYSQLSDIKNKKILDICCGYGFTSVRLAKYGAEVSSIDISPKMIELTIRNSQYNNVEQQISAQIMSAQQMSYLDETFDYVVGLGALHHLNIELAGIEISRVLKKGGKAIFLEPRIPLKLLIYVRSLLPQTCFESPGGSQLTDRDIKQFSQYFSDCQINYFLFLRKLARFPVIRKFTNQFDRLDEWLIAKMPFLKKAYWAFVVQFIK